MYTLPACKGQAGESMIFAAMGIGIEITRFKKSIPMENQKIFRCCTQLKNRLYL